MPPAMHVIVRRFLLSLNLNHNFPDLHNGKRFVMDSRKRAE
jgi:hypothetical protein